jgi:membrane associated rhomboid family serine protease
VVIPIHDDNPVRRRPIVTYLLIALNIAVFFVEPINHSLTSTSVTQAQLCQQVDFFNQYAAVPEELTSNRVLPANDYTVQTGNTLVRCTGHKHWKNPLLSVLTAMFLHGGWLHLLGNMLFLFVFGNNVEDRLGRLKFLGFYLICGYAAAYGFAFSQMHATESVLGASGAIAGVLGAYLVLFPRARVTTVVPFLLFFPFRLPAWVVLGFWFLLQWLYSSGGTLAEGSGVAYLAHVVGFVVGAFLVLIFGMRARNPGAPRYAG